MMGYGEDKGIIPIASEKIFDRINSNEDPNLTFRVETSMLEIYMEKVRDLFNPKRGENLKIRNDPKIGFYVQDLTKNAVADYRMVEKLMETGSKARTVASTNMNATSSRAHTIFMVILTQTKVDKEAGTATDKVGASMPQRSRARPRASPQPHLCRRPLASTLSILPVVSARAVLVPPVPASRKAVLSTWWVALFAPRAVAAPAPLAVTPLHRVPLYPVSVVAR